MEAYRRCEGLLSKTVQQARSQDRVVATFTRQVPTMAGDRDDEIVQLGDLSTLTVLRCDPP